MSRLRLGPAIGWPAPHRMQWEAYPSWLRDHPNVWPGDLRAFLADAKSQGLTQIRQTTFAGQIVVVATRPGDASGEEAFI